MRSVRQRDLVAVLRRRALLGAVRVADRHPHDRDRVVHAGDRRDSGDASAGADDHLAVDLPAQHRVGAADVVGTLRRDRRRLDAVAGLDHRACCRQHDLVVRAGGGSRARGRSARAPARSPQTSGSSRRSACSSSSCPVWSPSSTMMRRHVRHRRESTRDGSVRTSASARDVGTQCEVWCGTEWSRRRATGWRARRRPRRRLLPARARRAVGDPGPALGARTRPLEPWAILRTTAPPAATSSATHTGSSSPPRRAPHPGRVLLGGPPARWAKAGGRWQT